MKIVFLCIYSHPSICGVWSRVLSLSNMLIKKGHEVHVFSTNIIKGTCEKSEDYTDYKKIKIHRFPPKFSFGDNVKFWDFSSKLKEINPDLIIAEVYRHPHTHLALKVAKQLGKPCFLVTHAPFVEPELRTRTGNFIAKFYDEFYGKKIINQFDKIIYITKWELPYLMKLGAKKEKLVYIPNGISSEFFKTKRKKGSGILFLGRISPIKNLETLIKATAIVSKKHPDAKLKIVGPAEHNYKLQLEKLIKQLNIKNISFLPAIYDLKKKISLIDKSEIFVLPSKREAMPQSLIEAMSRGKIVIASDNKGSSEIISDKHNGFIFPIYNAEALAKIIDFCLENKLSSIRKNTIKKSESFAWESIFKKFHNLVLEYK